MPAEFQQRVHSNPVDVVPNGSGEYGRHPNNPVPVNGPIGELLYLSSLSTSNGWPIAFQRLGSWGQIDVFEIMSFDGREWDVFCFDMYYPRKSRKAPAGFEISGRGDGCFRGINHCYPNFPHGLFQHTQKTIERMVGIALADPRLKELDQLKNGRPQRHVDLVKTLSLTGYLRQ